MIRIRSTTTKKKRKLFNRKSRLFAIRVKEGNEVLVESAGWAPQGEMRGDGGGGGARGEGSLLLCYVCQC